jgi:DNA-binding NarL/FixJ family response regulator
LEDTGEISVVAETGDPDVAARSSQRLRPAVVLMEIAGGGAWWQTIREIRHVSPDTKIIVLSSRDDPHSIAVARDAGVHSYVPKRASMGDLIEAIRSAAMSVRSPPMRVFDYCCGSQPRLTH